MTDDNSNSNNNQDQSPSLLEGLQRIGQALNSVSQQYHAWYEENEETIQRGMAQLNNWARVFVRFLQYQKLDEIIVQSGWLPHHSLPADLYEKFVNNLDDWDDVPDEDLKRISNAILDFYQVHWSEIRPIIQASVEQYAPDQEALDTVVDALDAHDRGLYRCVCSVLFPTIERAMRITASLDSQDKVQYWSNKKIEEFMDCVRSGFPGMWFQVICDSFEDPAEVSVYGRFQDNNDLLRYKDTFVPNRHAVAHAFKAYNQVEHSLNAIFLADLMFWLISHYEHPNEQEDSY